MRSLTTIAGAVLLVLSAVTASDARVRSKRQAPAQSERSYYGSDYNTTRDRNHSCGAAEVMNAAHTAAAEHRIKPRLWGAVGAVSRLGRTAKARSSLW